jgi:L-seryl-tRNA(Ser) seleniumtransferase
MSTSLRDLPSVDRLLASAEAKQWLRLYARPLVVEQIRGELERARVQARAGGPLPSEQLLLEGVAARLQSAAAPTLRAVINASGVVLHTNLGRAELAPAAVAAVAAAAGAVHLEYDLERGGRGERDHLVEADLCALTGAEAATVVNNNAAAVLLALNTLAQGKEVVVSRGELIEIGGSFRLPDVLAKSGAHLHEVGTTNRTHRHDYEAAIGPITGALLKVHTSNYRIAGFTADVPLGELVEIGRARGVPVVEDLGSGALIDLGAYGLPREPVVADSVARGADLVTFSGDKLLGGPQAGLVVGCRSLIEKLRDNPLKRALRCDKLTLAALSATLRLYRSSPALARDLPALRWLARPLAEIEAVGAEALPILRAILGEGYSCELVPEQTQVGSGALPTETIETRAIAVTHAALGADAIAERFRRARPPVIGRVKDGRFLLDLRAIASAADLAVRL